MKRSAVGESCPGGHAAGDYPARELFALLPIPAQAKSDLLRRMTAPERRYHGLGHLDVLWERHRRFAPMAGLRRQDHGRIALAIAYHDAVYESGARDNEDRSAALWLSVSADGTVCSAADRDWIAETIAATADHLGSAAVLELDRPDHLARQWLLDLDLTPLGEPADVFDANMVELAAEMSNVAPAQRREVLLASLRHFASAQPLYRCLPLREAFEAAARENIVRHLAHEAGGVLQPL